MLVRVITLSPYKLENLPLKMIIACPKILHNFLWEYMSAAIVKFSYLRAERWLYLENERSKGTIANSFVNDSTQAFRV